MLPQQSKQTGFLYFHSTYFKLSECDDVSIINKIQNQIELISLSNGFIHLAAGFGDKLSRTVYYTL